VYSHQRLEDEYGVDESDINATIKALEDAVITAIRANTPIFFGCDVSKSSYRSLGILDTELYDLQAAFGASSTSSLSKADRMRMGESRSTHAIVITAVHLDEEGRPVRYKMENSWGEEEVDKGRFMMTAEWFREHAYLVVVPESQVEQRWLDVVAKGETVMLPPWDPMGL
jgi:bleomycin hydrolase